MNTLELVTALEEGKLLEKDYALAFGKEMGYYEEGDDVQYLSLEFFPNGSKYYNSSGWGSYNATESNLIELFKHPEYWRISKFKVEDRPWNL
jgi:hypothetical protein